MKILYFAWLRERVGIGEETVELPGQVANVGDFLDWMAERGDNYALALADRRAVRVALDQEHCSDFSASIGNVREIALFPPMTGG